MYTSFFGLNEKPFSITPDPRYLFMSERHGEALAHLVYGVTESGGFVQLTGEVGTGKTTLVRTLLLNRMPENADVAVVLNPQITAHEFLLTICEELGIDVPVYNDSIKVLTDALNHHLLSAHADSRRTILVVDEAQNLAPAVLEQVRLLTNLETAKQKLLQIILIGQPELRELLGRNDLRQLAQRITGRYHLEPLSRDETAQYIEHRLRVAGALGEIIDDGAKKAVFRLSDGVPRLINVICDRALLGAYSQETRIITGRLIKQAAAEVSGELSSTPVWRRVAVAAVVVTIGVVMASIWSFLRDPAPITVAVSPADLQPTLEATLGAAEPMVDTAIAATTKTLSEELALAGELTTIDFALASLFELWDLDYTRGANSACSQAAAAELACLNQRSSWSGLRQLNRPAILSVIDDKGEAHELVLARRKMPGAEPGAELRRDLDHDHARHERPAGDVPRHPEVGVLGVVHADRELGLLVVEALTMAGDRIYLAGSGGELQVRSATDGKQIAAREIPVPLWDGMAVAGGRLYVTTQDGKLLCIGADGDDR